MEADAHERDLALGRKQGTLFASNINIVYHLSYRAIVA